VLEQSISRGVFEPEEREPPAAVELSDDPRREPAEPSAGVVEKNWASHVGKGTSPSVLAAGRQNALSPERLARTPPTPADPSSRASDGDQRTPATNRDFDPARKCRLLAEQRLCDGSVGTTYGSDTFCQPISPPLRGCQSGRPGWCGS